MPRKTYKPGNFNLKVRRAKTGLGLFAMERIPAGACILEYTGKVLTDEEYARSRSRYLFDIGKGKVLDGAGRENIGRYINHSCAPNSEPSVYRSRPFVHALRDIEPGEEILYNYGEEYFDAYLKGKCRCSKCMPELAAAPAEAKPAAGAKAKSKAKAEPATASRSRASSGTASKRPRTKSQPPRAA